MDEVERNLLKTVCFFEIIGYAPTFVELTMSVPVGANGVCPDPMSLGPIVYLQSLLQSGQLLEKNGRIAFPDAIDRLILQTEERDSLQARKRRRARWVALWLSRLSGIRFVALANTTAWGHSRDFGDLDFFVIARQGAIWQTRLLAVLPFKLLGWLPREPERRDAVCLSYFVSDGGLDLATHQISGGDPYFEQWFLSLVSLFDDGVGESLWNENIGICSTYPLARPWMVPPDLEIRKPRFRLPVFGWFEPVARKIQEKWFPMRICSLMNKDTRVMVNDRVLKFHTDDGRAAYREQLETVCRQRGIV